MGSSQEETNYDAAATEIKKPKYVEKTPGYAPFPKKLRTAEHTHVNLTAENTPKRTAVLVLHGMGSQKPYEALDQFARGLLGFFRPRAQRPHRRFTQLIRRALVFVRLAKDGQDLPNPTVGLPTQDIRLRQHKANVNTNQQDWTQAYVRLRPSPNSPDVIDVYEYYWAPVITDRVSAVQSLTFLIKTGLTPFQYLRDNLMVINRAHAAASRSNRAKWLMFALLREVYRMLFIFIPLIAVAFGVYWLLGSSLHSIIASGGLDHISTLLVNPPLKGQQAVILALNTVRFLLFGMCVVFLFQEWFNGAQGKPAERSPGFYPWVIVALAAGLLFLPHFLSGGFVNMAWDLSAHHPIAVGLAVLLLFGAISFKSKISRSAWIRAWEAIDRHAALSVAVLVALGIAIALWRFRSHLDFWKVSRYLALPNFLNWRVVIVYTLLGLTAYIGRRVLTTAIGGLAVYLGADDLSKNFAARSQILHECTTLLIDLLTGLNEKCEANEDWQYDQVLIAAHSLGSVIAYDSLNQLIVRNLASDPLLKGVPLDKIKGLLTFGCPLNKVIYFFRTRLDLRTNVLSQILYVLHSFRLRTALPPAANPPIALPHPFPLDLPFSPEFRWFNAYSPFDIISGRMQFYIADRDIAVERGVTPWTAHLSYWRNDDLYSLFSDLMKP